MRAAHRGATMATKKGGGDGAGAGSPGPSGAGGVGGAEPPAAFGPGEAGGVEPPAASGPGEASGVEPPSRRRAAEVALRVVRRDAAPARRAVFERFARQGVYDLVLLDRLLGIAQAAWLVRRHRLRALCAAAGTGLSEEDAALAGELCERMRAALARGCGGRPDLAIELDHLRRGAGRHDLASDLETLAEAYGRDDVRLAIGRDAEHYRPADAAEARRLAGLLTAAAGPGTAAAGLSPRATALLLRGYDEHSRCGRFFFGNVEDIAATYPALDAAVRAAR